MCGRFSQSKDKQTIKKRFNVKKVAEDVRPLFNIAPDSDIAVILNDAPDEIKSVRWNLLPSWSEKEKTSYSMINARCETLTEKPSYKRLIAKKRCLIIADSFYEWKKEDGKKYPYRILLKNEDLIAFAGLWDLWEKEGKRILSCSIITTTPNKLCSGIHDRMPVILPQDLEKEWLSDISVDRALEMLKPYDQDQLKCYQISTLVNIPANNSPEIHLPLN